MKSACMLLLATMCGPVMASTATAPEQGAWLGCRIAPVPESLDAQFGLDDRGAMVINVAKGSPADKAGLERYDVVVKFGPDPVTSPDDLVERVSKHRASDKVSMEVLHKGRAKTVEVTLAARPKAGAEVFKYERLPDALLDDRVGITGRLFRRGPDGWTVEDLWELDDLPKPFKRIIPKPHRKHGRYWLEKERDAISKFQARVKNDQEVIEVEGNIGGPITVRRIRREGQSEKVREQTYPTPAELKKGDPEAHRIYEDATGAQRRGQSDLLKPPQLQERKRWLRDLFDKMPEVDRLLDREELDKLLEEKRKQWGQDLDREVQGVEKRLAEIEKRLRERLKELRLSDRLAPDAPSPTTRFEVSQDGKMTVHVREGDAELSLEFKDANELKAKRPELFRKYESLDKNR